MLTDDIRLVTPPPVDLSPYEHVLADCLVLRADGQVYVQRRERKGRELVTLFGGHREGDETPQQTVIRELYEETGARIDPADLVFVGAVTEGFSQHKDIVFVYFWHDRAGTITDCYEDFPLTFPTLSAALTHPALMPYARWAMERCMSLY